MDVRKIVMDLHQRGMRLSTENGRVIIEPDDGLTEADQATIVAHKPAIVAYLRSETTGVAALTMPTEPSASPVEAQAVAEVSTTPVAASPHKRRRGFTVDLGGAVSCGQCGARGQLPGNRDYIFWAFWIRHAVGALHAQMRPDEHLNWFARGLVQLQSPDGSVRHLRERDGEWCAETNQSEDSK